jgi:hypothetical protein
MTHADRQARCNAEARKRHDDWERHNAEVRRSHDDWKRREAAMQEVELAAARAAVKGMERGLLECCLPLDSDPDHWGHVDRWPRKGDNHEGCCKGDTVFIYVHDCWLIEAVKADIFAHTFHDAKHAAWEVNAEERRRIADERYASQRNLRKWAP